MPARILVSIAAEDMKYRDLFSSQKELTDNGIEFTDMSVSWVGQPKKVGIAKPLEEFRDVDLVKPREEDEQLYWTARKSHTVELTQKGPEYGRPIHIGRT